MNETVSEKLIELQKTHADFWNISPEVGQLLNTIILAAGYKNILELGTSNGYSAIWEALALEKTGGQLITLEFSEERAALAEKNLKDCNLKEYVTIIQGKILEILRQVDLKLLYSHKTEDKAFLDMAFIDASKLEYVEYFDKIHPMIRKNGIIIADNVISHENKVWNYIDLITAHENYQTTKLNIGTGLLLSLKIS